MPTETLGAHHGEQLALFGIADSPAPRMHIVDTGDAEPLDVQCDGQLELFDPRDFLASTHAA